MKKLFVCAMALAAFVSCSKDDVQGPALDSNNKTVSISIANGSSTRATSGGVSGVTAPGVGENGGTTMTCEADASDLTILFAKTDGTVMMKKQLTDVSNAIAENGDHTGTYVPETGNGEGGLYTWHNVPWEITRVAVVRVDPTLDASATLSTIKDYEDLALNEDANRERNLDQIVLFGEDVLVDTKTTHVVGTIYYHYWEAAVTVAPLLARFEINNIQCDNLGDYNPYKVENNGKYSFDELTIGAAAWTSKAGKTYTVKAVEGTVLYGSYNPQGSDKNNQKDATKRLNYVTADGSAPGAAKSVWSWNVNTTDTQFASMVVPLTAAAYDYTPAETSVPLNVTGLNDKDGNLITSFTPGHIYQLDLSFDEENIMNQDQLCVEVTVTIADWTINTVTPVFGAPGSANAQ